MTTPRSRLEWTAAAGLLWGLCWLPWLPATLFPVVFVVVLLALGRARAGREAASIGLVYAIAARRLNRTTERPTVAWL